MLPRPVGFVLGGGGSLGAAQVGMLQALAEAGIFADLVVGTSVGSLNGAIVAHDPPRAATALGAIWPTIRTQDVFPGSALERYRTWRTARAYLFESDALWDLIGRLLPVDRFQDLAIPFAAMATDVETARPVVLDTGLLRPALLASAAIPGVFPPVWHNGRTLWDGGLVANVPLRHALAMGARSLVVLDCNYPGQLPPPPSTLSAVITYVSVVAMRQQPLHDLPIAASQVPVVYLPGPALTGRLKDVNAMDFGHSAALSRGAYDAAKAFLDNLRVDGPGLYGRLDPA
jgi:NTE family protein